MSPLMKVPAPSLFGTLAEQPLEGVVMLDPLVACPEHVQTGNLFVVQDSISVRPRMIVGGSSEVVLRVRLSAEEEAIGVGILRIVAVGATTSSIEHLELFKPGETAPFALATVRDTGAAAVPTTFMGEPLTTFTARLAPGQLTIAQFTDEIIIVKARVKTDTEGGISGESARFAVMGDAALSEDTGAGAVHAYGLMSGRPLNGNDGNRLTEGEVFIGTRDPGPNRDIVAPSTHTAVMAKLADARNASLDRDHSTLWEGPFIMGQFGLRAAEHNNARNGLNKVVVDQITFTVNAPNVEIDLTSFKMLNMATPAVMQACTTVPAGTETYRVTCANLSRSTVSTAIDQGTEQILALRATITRRQISYLRRSSLQVTASFAADFRWYDRDLVTDVLFQGTDLRDGEIRSTLYEY